MSLKIEAGKWYRNREGHKRWVASTCVIGLYPVMVQDEDGCHIWFNHADGRARDLKEMTSAYDLVSEWIDLPEVDWDAMPKWANWVAMDDDDEWMFYMIMPTMGLTGWKIGGGGDKCGEVPKEYAPSFSGDWKKSLVQRPESK